MKYICKVPVVFVLSRHSRLMFEATISINCVMVAAEARRVFQCPNTFLAELFSQENGDYKDMYGTKTQHFDTSVD